MINARSLAAPNAIERLAVGALAFAAGISAQAKNPLGASRFAQGALPKSADVILGTLAANGSIKPQANWTSSLTGQNTANIDLGDGYKLAVDERNSELTIVNENTGERTRIWGDPHVDVNGQHKFDFWGTTTFQLANGTKVTINTEQFAANPNMYVASQVVITKGSNAIVIDGISQNKLGDLSVTQSNQGYATDSANRDGYVLHEAAGGWTSEHTGALATQQDLDATRVGQEYGPGSKILSLAESSGALSLFLFSGALGSMMNLAADTGSSDAAPARRSSSQRPAFAA